MSKHPIYSYLRQEAVEPEEFNKFLDILDSNAIEREDHTRPETSYGPAMLRVHFTYNDHEWSVIFGDGSYGFESGLLEAWDMTQADIDNTDPVGYLTAEQAWKYVTTGEEPIYDEYEEEDE